MLKKSKYFALLLIFSLIEFIFELIGSDELMFVCFAGFEKQMFNRQNEKQATEREAYLWSVADM